ncbi:MAG: 50S ribosomal protein L32 [candidate division WS2 bacterium]|uniref:Large ribosomal subunit protein bL32 n=1 Tax=Psychracetigena formicireducens TaxID=2986056 RepID=A0A9E2BJY4_PSYF1|nr:50S ribosomal protein L32 [Candidatus Psychracetigena formicireducens]MBT9144474.1 50S ribosomal protein L32 [Candidatus Psychracetigena formicireducens]MBT9149988.1 50S ribosomal protein L32 [Candidatus Psychracetigena formicireducens]
MGVPNKKVTRKTISQRQSTQKLNCPEVAKCSNCSKLIPPHTVCPYCGFYKGKKAIIIKEKKEKEGAK